MARKTVELAQFEQAAKALEEAREQSVQSRATQAGAMYGSAGFLLYMAGAGELIAPWWSRKRDHDLSVVWKQSDHVSGAKSQLTDKVVNVPVRVMPRDTEVKAHMRQAEDFNRVLLEESEYGAGWTTAASKWLEDWWMSDNGAFFEVTGDGDKSKPIVGPATGLEHMDSLYCVRTGDVEFPVVWQDPGTGELHRMHRTRVAFAADNPSSRAQMRGVGFCLHRDATVLMADGRYVRIADLVKSGSTEEVMSVDENGGLVAKRIENWYTNERGERRMVNIRGRLAKSVRGVQERNSWVTEDHPIMTPNGWVNAGDLRTGDEAATGFRHPGERMMAFLVGALMGDGSLTVQRGGKAKRLPRFSMGHCLAQEEWFDIKARLLEPFGFKSRYYDYKLIYKGKRKVHPGKSGQTTVQPGFCDLYDAFYTLDKSDKRTKRIPFELIEKFMGPELLAAWYLDDGHITDREPNERGRKPHARFCTSGFTVEEVERLISMLCEAGFECSVISARGEEHKRDIRFTVDGSAKLFDVIGRFVPPTMRYKVSADAPAYDPSSWELGGTEILWDEVEVKGWDKIRSDGKPHNEPLTVYCIDVEDTHNFITAGIVVHNCAMSRAINNAQTLTDILVYNQEKMGSRPKRGIILGKGVRTDLILRSLSVADQGMDDQGLRRFAKFPIIGDLPLDAIIEILDLASLPDNFDYETWTRLGMFALALAFGVPIRWIWPAATSGATKADAMYQHIAGLGGGVGKTLKVLTFLLGGDPRGYRHTAGKFLPPHLKLVFDFQDDEQDKMRAEVAKTRSETRKNDLDSGVTNTRVSREQALEAGDVTPQQFAQLELDDGRLEDGADVLTLFHSVDPFHLRYLDLGVEDPLDAGGNDPARMVEEAERAALDLNDVIANVGNPGQRGKARQALAALAKLKGIYEGMLAQEVQADVTAEIEAGAGAGQAPAEAAGGEAPPEGQAEAGARKSFQWGASAGEVIQGQLARGAGGQFVSAEEMLRQIREGMIARRGAARSGGGRGGSAEAKRAANRAAIAEILGLADGTTDALAAMRAGTATPDQYQAMLDQGLAQTNSDGSVMMKSSARSLLNAANSGDADRAKEALAKAKEPPKGKKPAAGKKPGKTAADRERERQAREMERLAKIAENRQAVAEALGDDAAGLPSFVDFMAGADLSPDDARALAARGLVRITSDGSVATSPAGRALAKALDSGDVRAAKDAVAKGKEDAAKVTAKADAIRAAADEVAAAAAEAESRAGAFEDEADGLDSDADTADDEADDLMRQAAAAGDEETAAKLKERAELAKERADRLKERADRKREQAADQRKRASELTAEAEEKATEADEVEAEVGGRPLQPPAGGKGMGLVDRLKRFVGLEPRGRPLRPFDGDVVPISAKDVARAVAGWDANKDLQQYRGILGAREPTEEERAAAEAEAPPEAGE